MTDKIDTDAIDANAIGIDAIDKVRRRNERFEFAKARKRAAKIITFGCQMNENDSEKIMGLVREMGFVEYDDGVAGARKPDLVVLNSCCVRENAENKLFGYLGVYKKVRELNLESVVAVCGCMMQEDSAVKEINKKFKFVDIIFGTHNIHEFPILLERLYEKRDTQGNMRYTQGNMRDTPSKKRGKAKQDEKQYSVWDNCDFVIEGLPIQRKAPPSALVSIMYGCNNFCSYCVVPYVRGRERSRAHEDIIREIRGLASDGYKEITLLGQNVNSYGQTAPDALNRRTSTGTTVEQTAPDALNGQAAFGDVPNGETASGALNEQTSPGGVPNGQTSSDGVQNEQTSPVGVTYALNSRSESAPVNATDFPDLLAMISEIDGIERIRFMTSHPKDLSDKLIYAIRDLPPVCEHVHLPIQSGSSEILKKMNRHYSKEEYIGLINRLRVEIPDIVITTDIIVGFPGETEEDFAETLDVVKVVRFDMAYTFIYSRRENTPAAEYIQNVGVDIIKARFNRLVELQNKISLEKNMLCVGREMEVLCEGYSKNNPGKLTGRSRGGKLVHFEGGADCIGEIMMVKIDAAQPFCLEGRLM